MLLPPALFNEIQPHLTHHDCWHAARFPGQVELRQQFDGECEAGLKALNEPGSGCDFLRFHRRMMRHFFWMLDQHPELRGRFEFTPWSDDRLPMWVEDLVRESGFDLTKAYETIDELIASGSVDHLGGFIEPTMLHQNEPGAGLHARVHKRLGAMELKLYPGDQVAPMTKLGRAPGNIFFWTLHGWIDSRFAEWQRRHGETVDQTPQQMPHSHVTC